MPIQLPPPPPVREDNLNRWLNLLWRKFGLGTGVETFLQTPSSANLAAALTDETGSGSAVFATSPTLVTPVLGTPTSGTLTNCTGLPISTGVSGLGTGIAAALAVNTGSAGAPVLFDGALGTPSSGTVTNLTGTASININGTVGATTPAAGTFTTLNATGGGALTGTWTNLGSVATADINGGTIDGTTIGGASAAAITGTTITANTRFVGAHDGTLGATTPAAATVTTLSASGLATLSVGATIPAGQLLQFAGGDVTAVATAGGSFAITNAGAITNGNIAIQAKAAQNVALRVGGVTIADVASTGLSVTGTLSATGNVTLGDASTDTLNVGNGGIIKDASGNVGIGVTPSARNNTTLQIKDGIGFPATQVASSDANTLDDYREATYTGTLTGCTTSPTGSIAFVRVGNKVTLSIPGATFWGTSNATTMTITGGPTTMRPATLQTCVGAGGQDNYANLTTPLLVEINVAGTITFYKDMSGAAFTNTGDKGVNAVSISYILS